MKDLAVFASGHGTNFEALPNAADQPDCGYRIAALVCDQSQAPVIQKAAARNILTIVVDFKSYPNKTAAETAILEQLPPVSALILAGYMRIIGPTLLRAFPKKIINLHPALLPSFPGRQGIQDAFDYGVKVTGVTVHFVDAGIDTGEIIAQVPVNITDGMSLAELEQAIHRQEHQIFPATVKNLIQEGAI